MSVDNPQDWCGDCTPEGTKACPMKPTCAEVAAQPPGEPNYGTCENHPHHVCRCTDADRAWAKAVAAFVIPTTTSEGERQTSQNPPSEHL